ncbi:hypothetical protein D9M71_600430 [compost metagenome]
MQAGYLEGVKIDPGDHQRGEKRPAPHRQYRHAVQHAGGAQHQPGRAQFLRQAFDHQAHGQGDDADEYQVEKVEVPGLAGKRQDDAEGRHDRDEGHRLPGEVLLAEVADDQVEQKPDADADAEDQQAERMQAFEIMLTKLPAQLGRCDIPAHLLFDGLVHGGLAYSMSSCSASIAAQD